MGSEFRHTCSGLKNHGLARNSKFVSYICFQDYLRDLDITVLGDVISILKHAKDVQSKQDSDVFIVPEAKKVDRKVSPAPPPQVKEVPKQIEKKPETVSARLGPPKAMKFPTPIPASSGGGKSKSPLETNF